MAVFRFKFLPIEPTAGLYGNRIDPIVYRRGRDTSGQPARCIRCPDVDEPPNGPDELTAPESQAKMIEEILVRYAALGRFTETETRTLRAVWVEHESLRSIARREGVSRQAVFARIVGVLKKAPEFAADWPLIKRVERFWWSE